MRTRFYWSMLSLLPLVLVFDVIYFLSLGSQLYFWLTVSLHVVVYGPVSWLGAWRLYRPLHLAEQTGQASAKVQAQIQTLTWKATFFVFCLGFVYLAAFFGLSPLLPQTDTAYAVADIPPVLFLTFLPSLIYIDAVFPAFIVYFVMGEFTLNFKLHLFEKWGWQFTTGRRKIGRTLLFAFVTTGVLPSLLVLLSLYSVDHLSAEFARFTSLNPLKSAFPDRFIEIVGMIFAVVFITRSFTHPIHALQSKINQVKTGDYSTRSAVVTSDEIGVLTSEFNSLVAGLQERELMRDTFGKYVTKDIAQVILDKKINLEGEVRQATILVTDIAGYTTLAEGRSPRETVQLLNEYFSVVVGIIQNHRGVVNKFIGDSIFALFNVPLDDPGHAAHAVQAALEIRKITAERQFGHGQAKPARLTTRIGINTGPVLAGNIGSSDRAEYTVIGDEVNVAARLESLNKELQTQILVGENTWQLVRAEFDFADAGVHQLKGRSRSIRVFKI